MYDVSRVKFVERNRLDRKDNTYFVPFFPLKPQNVIKLYREAFMMKYVRYSKSAVCIRY